MSVHFHALRTKHRASFTASNIDGTMSLTRWEWGIGKGAQKRRLHAIAGEKWLSTSYFLIGARYAGEYGGPRHVIDALWQAL